MSCSSRLPPAPSAFDGVSFVFAHVVGVALDSAIPDLPDACSPVGSEDEGEHLGDGIIELFARVRVRELDAIGTTLQILIRTTAPYLAPRGP